MISTKLCIKDNDNESQQIEISVGTNIFIEQVDVENNCMYPFWICISRDDWEEVKRFIDNELNPT